MAVENPNLPIPATQTAAASYAFQADQQIRHKVALMKHLWIELAEDLYRFARGQLWRDLNYSSFESWLRDGIDLERRWVFEHIAMYEQLVVERGVDKARVGELHVSKVREVLPAIRRGEIDIETGLSDAEVLPRSELETRYRGLASSGDRGTVDSSSTIETDSEPALAVCPTCGSTYRIRR